jgi:hypothetical protein
MSSMSSPGSNGIDYSLAYIPGDFQDTSTQAFDPIYMTKLFDLGFRLGQAGYPWKKAPPPRLRSS